VLVCTIATLASFDKWNQELGIEFFDRFTVEGLKTFVEMVIWLELDLAWSVWLS